jgi:hypothetical protein
MIGIAFPVVDRKTAVQGLRHALHYANNSKKGNVTVNYHRKMTYRH